MSKRRLREEEIQYALQEDDDDYTDSHGANDSSSYESQDDTDDIFIGDDLRSFTPYFKSYQSYLNNYENASVLIRRITNLERNKFNQFNEWYDKQKAQFVDNKSMDFYLILPIQRLPRYKLCLHEIIKNTEEDHPDFEQLKKAEQAIVDVTTLCNVSPSCETCE